MPEKPQPKVPVKVFRKKDGTEKAIPLSRKAREQAAPAAAAPASEPKSEAAPAPQTEEIGVGGVIALAAAGIALGAAVGLALWHFTRPQLTPEERRAQLHVA